MGRGLDLETLREFFADKRIHIALALVEQVEVLLDQSKCKAKCKVLPEEFEIVAEVTFGATGPGAGDFQVPQPADLVMVAFSSDTQEGYVVQRLTSKADSIPKTANAGHRVIQALDGKNLFLGGAAVYLGGGGDAWAAVPPDEPVPLGNVLKDCLNSLFEKFDALLTKLGTGPLVICGSPGSPGSTYPALATDITALQAELTTLKTQYLDTAGTNILSGKAFTER